MNKARLVSCILYLRAQKRFYIEYHQDLELLFQWLGGSGETIFDKEIEISKASMPDICGECLHCFEFTVSGRVREGCCYCHETNHLRPALHYYWPMKMSEILNCTENVLETYMAEALWVVKEMNSREA